MSLVIITLVILCVHLAIFFILAIVSSAQLHKESERARDFFRSHPEKVPPKYLFDESELDKKEKLNMTTKATSKPSEKKVNKSQRKPKKPSTKNFITHVGIVLDESGSMASMPLEVVNGFNEQINLIKEESKKAGKTTITIVSFSTSVRKPLLDKADIEDVVPLTMDSYKPDSLTALNDGIMRTISLLEEGEVRKNTAYLLLIFTDGYENASRDFTTEAVKKKIEELRATKQWTITLLGAKDIDPDGMSRCYSIAAGNVMNFSGAQGPQGVSGVLGVKGAVGSSMSNYYAIRRTGVTGTDEFTVQNNAGDEVEEKNK